MRAASFIVVGVLLGVGCEEDATLPGSTSGAAGSEVPGSTAGSGTAGTLSTTAGSPALTAGSGASGSPAAGAGRGGAGSPAGRSGGSSGATGAGSGGVPAAGSGGSTGTAGAGMAGSPGTAGAAGASGAGGMAAEPTTEKFSFFVTSLGGMRELSKSMDGFGGDLRFGESTGLGGADKICTTLAEKSMPGAGAKGWRAFLSTAKGGEGGGPVHAKDRVGAGPWYDRSGRVVAMNLTELLKQRPGGADAAIVNDLPNENGIPNRKDAMPGEDDNHDTITATNEQGMFDGGATCNDWTSIETPGATGAAGSGTGAGGRGGGGRPMGGGRGPRVGHSWPAQSGMNWMAAHGAPGCAPSVSLIQMGGGSGTGIGNGGGYGGFYCFALKP